MKNANRRRNKILRSAVSRRPLLGGGGLKWIETLEARQLLSAASLHYNVIDLGRPNDIDTNATAINNVGQIAGQSVTATTYLPWVYNYNTGTLTDLTPVLGNEVEINSINDSGQMVGAKLTGTFDSTGEPITTAFYYAGTGSKVTTLPLGAGMESASAVGINDKGQIVAIERTFPQPDGPYMFTYTYGFLYSAGTGKLVGGIPQGDTDIGALAINNAGQIFENAFNPPFKQDNGTGENFLYSANKMIPLTSSVTAPGPWFGNPIPASLGDTIAQYDNIGGSPFGTDPFGANDAQAPYLYSAGQMINLNDTLPANTNFTLNFVNNINASDMIVGQGMNEEGQDNAFLLLPVKPSISGTVFNDANHNGVQDPGESGIAGVTVYEDPNYNHKPDAGEQSAVTDAQGNYTFTNLPADPEILRVILPSGAQQTLPANGVGIYVGKNLTQSLTGENFGVYTPPAKGGTITGTVFNDENGDHVFQFPSEPYQAGITAYADINNDGKFDAGDLSAVTNSQGSFAITGVPAGTFYVDIAPTNTGFRRTIPVAGQDSFRVTVRGNFTVGVGIFGVTNTAYVGGTLFNDVNGNGVQDPHETPLAGWTVYIDLNHDGIHESNEPVAQTVTTATGYWYFRAVAAGTYTIRAVTPSGWTSTHAYTVTLTKGEMVTNGAIGEVKG